MLVVHSLMRNRDFIFGLGPTVSHKVSCWTEAGFKVYGPLQATPYVNLPDKAINDDVVNVDCVICANITRSVVARTYNE